MRTCSAFKCASSWFFVFFFSFFIFFSKWCTPSERARVSIGTQQFMKTTKMHTNGEKKVHKLFLAFVRCNCIRNLGTTTRNEQQSKFALFVCHFLHFSLLQLFAHIKNRTHFLPNKPIQMHSHFASHIMLMFMNFEAFKMFVMTDLMVANCFCYWILSIKVPIIFQ